MRLAAILAPGPLHDHLLARGLDEGAHVCDESRVATAVERVQRLPSRVHAKCFTDLAFSTDCTRWTDFVFVAAGSAPRPLDPSPSPPPSRRTRAPHTLHAALTRPPGPRLLPSCPSSFAVAAGLALGCLATEPTLVKAAIWSLAGVDKRLSARPRSAPAWPPPAGPLPVSHRQGARPERPDRRQRSPHVTNPDITNNKHL